MRAETKILIKALEVMKNGHWNNGGLYIKTEDGRDTYCAMGGISKAAEGAVRYVGAGEGTKAADRAADILASVIKIPGGRSNYNGSTSSMIASWNDDRPEGAAGFRTIKAGFCRAIKKSMEPASKPAKKVRKRAA